MYKSKLQELCQRRSWGLPEYTTVKDGPDHMPRFTATVNVRGQVFATPENCRSSKDAQNTAARIAFEQLSGPLSSPPCVQSSPAPADSSPAQTVSSVASLAVVRPSSTREMLPVAEDPPVPESPPPSSLPIPTLGFLSPRNDANSKTVDQNSEDTQHNSTVYKIAIGSHDKSSKGTLHIYKNRLQQYAQKQNIGFPVYTYEVEGPPHTRRFKSRVSLSGKSYETVEFFPTLKEAEQAAAKVACQVLSVDGVQEDAGLYKNLLQEFAQKKGFMCPSYDTMSSGVSHVPVFVSTVEIGSYSFRGDEAKTKKQAEMNAAKVAYCTLTESYLAMESSRSSSSGVTENLTHDIQSMVTAKKHHGIDEEAQIQAKKAKTLPENVNMNASVPGSSNLPSDCSSLLSSQMDNRSSIEPAADQSIVYEPSHKHRNIVMPRNSSLPRPEGAEVMPYSNDQWVAYKVEPTEETTA